MKAYKKDGTTNANATVVILGDSEDTPTGFTHLATVVDIEEWGWHSGADYKTVRDCIKKVVQDAGAGNVEAGFNTLTDEEKKIAASHNIGTGQQIKDTITDRTERDNNSLQYLINMKGHPNGVRAHRALFMEAVMWSRCKHLTVTIPPSGPTLTMPEFVYGLLTISSPGIGEIIGNLLVNYEGAGIQGFVSGDMTLGIDDFTQETPNTRFAPYHETTNPTGGGLRTHPLLSSLVPDGFANIGAFADYLHKIRKGEVYAGQRQ